MNYIWILVTAIVGILIGVIITKLIQRKTVSCGTLVIDLTDPEKDIYRLIVDEDLESLAKQKQVLLRVHLHTDSQQ